MLVIPSSRVDEKPEAQEYFHTLHPVVKVDGGIDPLESVDEIAVNQESEVLMMLGEIKALRKLANMLSGGESYILIDGPVIDPPLYGDERYVEERVDALRYCYDKGINVVGFVKRVMGSNYLNILKNKIGKDHFTEFINDLDLLSTVMFDAAKAESSPVYTLPENYEDGCEDGSKSALTYSVYKSKGLRVYYSYYKPLLRGRIFRVEYASFKDLGEQEISEKFSRILSIISHVWTMPGMDEPLLILIAHNKCNVRRGAAEKLYYEIMARALSEGNIHLWLERTT